MKTCKKCGKLVKDENRFCPYCGERMEEQLISPEEEKHSNPSEDRPEAAEEKHSNPFGDGLKMAGGKQPGKGKLPGGVSKKMLAGIAAAVVILIVAVVLLMRPKYTTIVPNEYVKVTCKGLDGKGTAVFVLDTESLKTLITQEQELKPAQQNELESLLKQAEKYLSLSQEQNLSNGDSIMIQSELPSDYLKAYHVKIKNDDFPFAVAGLIGVQTVKLEDYVTFTFTGFEKHGYVSYEINDVQMYEDISEMVRRVDDSATADSFIEDKLYGVLFYSDLLDAAVEPAEGLSNGDKVNFTCTAAEETGLEEYGIEFAEASVEKVVEGLDTLETVELAPYIQMQFEGFEGQGTASYTMDWEKLAADLDAKFPEGRKGYNGENMAGVIQNYVLDYMEKSVEPREGLFNGDEVRIRFNGDREENYLSSLGFVLENVDMTVSAEGITEVDTLNLGEYLTVSFSGFDKVGEAEVSLDMEKLRQDLLTEYADGRGDYDAQEVAGIIENAISWYYLPDLDKTSELSNGEEVQAAVHLEGYVDEAAYAEETEQEALADVETEMPEAQEMADTETGAQETADTEKTGREALKDAETETQETQETADTEKTGREALKDAETPEAQELADTEKTGREALKDAEIETEEVGQQETADTEETTGAADPEAETEQEASETETEDQQAKAAAAYAEKNTWYVSELGINLQGGKKQITVEGLTPQTEVDLLDYFVMEFDGYEKRGTATYFLDNEKLYEDISEMVRQTDPSEEGEVFIRSELYGMLGKGVLVNHLFEQTVEPTEGLSNGDKVNVTCKLAAEATILEQHGITLKEVSAEIEVEGLDSLKTLDLTPYIQVKFDNFNGLGTASYSIDEELLTADLEKEFPEGRGAYDVKGVVGEIENHIGMEDFMETTVEPSEALSNGDEVRIRYTGSGEENYISSVGIILENVDMTVTVEGLEDVEDLDLGEYLTVSFTGFEEVGVAEVLLDAEKLEKDLSSDYASGRGGYDAETVVKMVEEKISGNFVLGMDISSELSNGDEVQSYVWLKNGKTLTEIAKEVKTGADSAKEESNTLYVADLGLNLQSAQKQVTVEGLKPQTEIDLLEYAAITFKGFEADGVASFTIDNSKLYEDAAELVRQADASEETETYIRSNLYKMLEKGELLKLTVDQSQKLSNGDKVKFECEVSEEAAELKNYGVKLKGISVEKEVDGLVGVDTIDLGDYLSTSFTGYNEVGKATVRFDTEKLEEDLLFRYESGRGEYGVETVVKLVERQISGNTSVGVDSSSGLSNGDKVQSYVRLKTGKTLTEIAGEAEEDSANAERNILYIADLGINLQEAEKQVTVEGLEPQTEVDLMDIVQVEFSGITPMVYVNVTVDDQSPLYQYIDHASISDIPASIAAYNGDELEVTLKCNLNRALENGYKITNYSRKYVISGLSTYDFTLDTVGERLLNLAEARRKEAVSLALPNENSVWEMVTEEGVQILWAQADTGLDRIVKLYSEVDPDNYNRMVLVYKTELPIIKKDGQIFTQPVYSISVLENVSESDKGIGWGRAKDNYYCGSSEAVSETLDKLVESVWGENGCIRTEMVNEELEKELAPGAEREEKEDSGADAVSEEDTGEAEVFIVTEVAAPEISQAGQAKAVASVELDGHRYYLFDEAVTWQEAETLCEQENGTLATVTSWPEQAALEYLIQQGEGNHYWLGGSDAEAEGDWTWVTGEEFVYSCWNGSQPDNSDDEDYVVISRSFDNQWNDYPADKEGVGYILEVSGEQEAAGEYLVDSDTLRHESEIDYDTWGEDSYGDLHFGGIYLNASNQSWQEYELDGGYEWLVGEVFVYGDDASEASLDLAVFGDGKLLWSESGITRQTDKVTLTANVSGVRKLTIITRNMGEGKGWLILDRAKLYAGDPDSEAEDKMQVDGRLSEQYVIEGSDYSRQQLLRRDTAGELHDDYLLFDAGKNAGIAWNLQENYSVLTGKFVTRDGTGADVSMWVNVYGDDELLFTAEGINKVTGQVPFEVDVTGVRILRIETGNDTEGGDAYLYLAEDVLSKTGQSETALTADESGDVVSGAEPAEKEENGASDAEALTLPANVRALASGIAEYDSCVYALIETPATWESARKFCEQMGGHLAVITSRLEQARVQELLRNATADGYWIGASDAQKEGEWVWVTGEPWSYECWSGNEPSNSNSSNGGENYLEIYTNGAWNDLNEEKTRGFIFELSSEDAESETSTELPMQVIDNAGEVDNCEFQMRSTDIRGKVHLSNYYFSTSKGGWLTCELNGAYETFRGTIVPASGADQNAKMNMAIFGDGRLLYAKNGIDGWSGAASFEADVTGVKTLMIRTSNTGEGNAPLLLTDTFLDMAQEPSLTGRSAALADLQLIDSAGLEYHDRLFRNIYGDNYDGDCSLFASTDGYGVWRLDGAYTEFSVALTTSASTGADSSMSVQIYADEELIFETEGLTRNSEPVSVTLDVTGAKNLKIVTDDVEGTHNGYLYLVTDELK